jgi:hypothetical protein
VVVPTPVFVPLPIHAPTLNSDGFEES